MSPAPDETTRPFPLPDLFAGAGPVGDALAAIDWTATSLGPVDRWPQSLRTTVALCLSSRAPMMIVWGPEHVQLYNDALAPMMGPKHPAALGRPYAESFPEIWHIMGPMLQSVTARGDSSYLEDLPVFFDRQVPGEEMYWTFSWSPLRDEQGALAGALHPAEETTGRVLAERRLRLLRDLATSAGQASAVDEACARAVDVLAEHPLDTPFAAVYVLDDVPGLGVPVAARRAATSGVLAGDDVFPPEVDLTASTFTAWPLATAASSGRPEGVDLDLDPALLPGWPWPEGPTRGLVLPLSTPGRPRPVALLALGLNPRRPSDEAQQSFLQLLAGQLATALTTAALHEQQYRVGVALQRSLMPDIAGATLSLDVAARYRPGSTDAQVGGDWYDVIPLGAGRTALVVGDVMGHGVRAAAVMGQVRAAVRAYAQLDLPPGQVLELLDRLVEQISAAGDVGQIVTCTYAVHDPGDGTLTLACAGHPPGLLFDAAGCAGWEGPVGPPLGVGIGPYAAQTRPFPAGAGLLLYTDGLVERRTSDVDVGIDRLLGVLREARSGDLERLADAALAVQDDGERDDVALLAVRVPRSDLPPPVVVDLQHDARAARTARHRTGAALEDWGAPDDLVRDAALVASELVNNAVTHTGRPRQLRLRRLADRVVVEVADADARPPHRLAADVGAEGGRGMVILAGLTSDWGVRHDGSGKVVWCELPLEP